MGHREGEKITDRYRPELVRGTETKPKIEAKAMA